MRYLYSPKNERIYDPQAGTGISTTDAVAKYKDDPNIFISFTKIEKIGINPQSKYNTPIGIYCYPLKEFWKLYKPNNTKPFGKFAPFAGKNEWVNVLKRNRYGREFIEDIGDPHVYNKKNYEDDISIWASVRAKEIEQMYKPILLRFMKANETDKIDSRLLSSFIDYYFGKSNSRIGVPGEIIWYATRSYANKPVAWTKLFLDMGIVGIADRSGKGIIHPNEPMQAVFFTTRAFDLVERIENNVLPKSKEIKLSSSDDRIYREILDKYVKMSLDYEQEISRNYLFQFLSAIIKKYGPDVAIKALFEPPYEYLHYIIAGPAAAEMRIHTNYDLKLFFERYKTVLPKSFWNSFVENSNSIEWYYLGNPNDWIF